MQPFFFSAAAAGFSRFRLYTVGVPGGETCKV